MPEVDVAIVGAGLAGLRCAPVLEASGLEVAVFERGATVGGRIQTDVVDGYLIDRGFQLLNPAYAALRASLDLAALELRPLVAGVALGSVTGPTLLDPRRAPGSLPATLQALPGPRRSQLAFGRLAAQTLIAPQAVSRRLGSVSTAEGLTRLGITGPLRSTLLDPFLVGVTLDPDLEVPLGFTTLVLRSMLLGRPSVPARGMGELPRQLARQLATSTVRLGAEVERASATEVFVEGTTYRAKAVVLGVDAQALSRFDPDLPPPPMGSVTTYWHATSGSAGRALLAVAPQGPWNSVELSAAAPRYAPAGRRLFATSTPTRVPDAAARTAAAALQGLAEGDLELVAVTEVDAALPLGRPPLELDRLAQSHGRFVAGDHTTTASIQGALVSGARAAHAVMATLGVDPPRKPRPPR